MKRFTLALLLLVGCSSSAATEPPTDTPSPDAGDAGPTSGAGGSAGSGGAAGLGAAAGKGGAAGSGGGDAGKSGSAGTDAAAADAGDAGKVDAGGSALDAVADGPAIPDAIHPDADAGGSDGSDSAVPPNDAPAADARTDAAPVDARTDATLPCTASAPTCEAVNRYEAQIRATFTEPCVTDAHQCGGLVSGSIVDTVPMTCKAGAWSLAWCLNAACYSCSMQCQANQLCNP